MNLLFARFALMLLIAAGIAWIALDASFVGAAMAASSTDKTEATCAVEGAAAQSEAALASRDKDAPRGAGRSALRWQSFLPGTFRR